MDINLAEQINSWLCACQFHTMGLGNSDCFESLRDISLDDMLLATRTVERRGTQKNEAGQQLITPVCEDRAVAAVYTILHYDPWPQDAVEPIIARDGKILAHIDLVK